MPEKLFYNVFTKKEKITDKNIIILKKELLEFFKSLKDNNDIDNIKVLYNKLELTIKNSKKKISKKNIKSLHLIIEKIDCYIEKQKKEVNKKEEIKLIDVVKAVEKKYKRCDTLSEEKMKQYTRTCRKTSTIQYEKDLALLQLELVKLQKYIKDSEKKVLIIFEGRDAAWKGGTIKRFMENLNPRLAKVVALNKPTEEEQTQWYFQRYVKNLPNGWEMSLFDRSWYNRWWVEPVMWFCTKDEYEQFLKDVVGFEKMLVENGIKIIKFYFSVSKATQAERFEARKTNPLKQYKLSPVDQFSQKLWDKYTLAEYKNFSNTHTGHANWTLINSDDKKRARLNAIKVVLSNFKYPNKISKKLLKIDSDIVYSGKEKVKRLSEEINIKKDLFD
jgi:polyphosphate kinase 2